MFTSGKSPESSKVTLNARSCVSVTVAGVEVESVCVPPFADATTPTSELPCRPVTVPPVPVLPVEAGCSRW